MTAHGDNREERVLSVSQVNRRARGLLEDNLAGIWVDAEVTDVTRARSGHLYFRLAEPGGGSSIDAVMWKGQAMRYASVVERGKRINCHGRVTLYEAGGRYQIVVDRVREAGEGDKAKKLALLKEKLKSEGLFDPKNKRELPLLPACVAVVTSRTGAALRDIAKVMRDRFPTRVLLFHAQVQGDTAPAQLCDALNRAGMHPAVEVVILGRGGGAKDDLDAFNEESVARSVAECPVPVVSAVGHEIDVSVTDLVADRRAATPSEAAQLVVPELEEMRLRLREKLRSLGATFGGLVLAERRRLSRMDERIRTQDPRVRLRRDARLLFSLKESLAKWPAGALAKESDRLAGLREGLHRWPDAAIGRAKGDLMAAGEGLYRWPDPFIAVNRGRIGELAASLEALSPLGVLSRGYSVVRLKKTGEILKDEQKALEGDELEIALAKGAVSARVIGETKEEQ